MYNLEKEIARWRQRMAAGGINAPAVLDELESHLREEIEQQFFSGAGEQEAFEAAVLRIGQAGRLKCEFAKVDKTKPVWQREAVRALIGFGAGFCWVHF